MDIVILSLAVGLGVPLRIGVGNFVPIYLGVTNVLPILLTLFLHSDRLAEYKLYGANTETYRHSISVVDHYDFVIVGGGAAGCVLANRLSRHFTVLLMERGGNPNPLTFVPALENLMLSRPETDYAFQTAPQKSACFSCNQRRQIWNQGRGLGGSGMINSMVYLRGHPYDYDNWAYYTNDKRWKYKNVLPYFLRSENYCYECEEFATVPTPLNEKYHATGGELPIMKPFYTPLLEQFLRAVNWADVQIQDLNAPFFYSAANVASFNQKTSRRYSAFSSFILPILHRSNLHIWRYTQGIEILFHGKSNVAYGVKYERFGKIGKVIASKEVIISSGAINTPKLLMQSGIGPEHELSSHKIPVRLNLAVGYNLQDHVGTMVGPILIDKPLSRLWERDVNYLSVIQYLYNGTGPLSIPFPVANAFWSSSRGVMDGESEWPDIQVGFAPSGVSAGLAEGLSRAQNLNVDVLNEFFNPVVGHDAFFLIIDYARPKSRGRVKLKSAHHTDDPIIEPRYYEDPHNEDIIVTVEALQKACFIAENAPAFKELGARLSPVPFPPCKHKPFKSPSYWECVARHFTITFHHYAATASMGSADSKYAVVDSELRVIGAHGLRVIDSSVIPFVTSTNTHAPTIMIAERGADLILEYWTNKLAQKHEDENFVEHTPKIKPSSITTFKPKPKQRQRQQRSKTKSKARLGWDDPLKWFAS